MSFPNTVEADLLKLILQNVDAALLGDAGGLRGSATAGSIYVALHSADPTETGDQTTNEIAYTSYARVAVVRSAGQWTISGTAPTQAANTNPVNFPTCTGGSATATYFSLGYATSGAGKLWASGALTASLAISNGITPSFAASQLVATMD